MSSSQLWHEALRELYDLVSAPGSRVIEDHARRDPDAAPLSKSTVSKLLKGETNPRRATVRAFVLGCLAYARTRRRAVVLPDGHDVPEFWMQRYDSCVGAAGYRAASGASTITVVPRRVRVAPPYWATMHEIHGRTEQLIGRQQELNEIAEFATGTDQCLWLVAGAWAGKSSLLAEAATTAVPHGVDVIAYFLSQREADADSNRFLTAVVPQLAYLLDEDAPLSDLHQFRALWTRAAGSAAAADRDLLLIVDGLDEDIHPVGSPSVAAILPAKLHPRTHVLVSSRGHMSLPIDVPLRHPLHDARRWSLTPYEGARMMAGLAAQEIDSLKRSDERGLAHEILGFLAAAAGPLTVADLAELASSGDDSNPVHTTRVRRLIIDQAARSLQPVGPKAGRRYQFTHVTLLEQARVDDDLNDANYRTRLHRWASRWRKLGWPIGEPTSRPATPKYLLDSYVRTLQDDPIRLMELVCDLGWVIAAIETAGVDTVLADLQMAIRSIPAATGGSAIHSAVRAQAHHLRVQDAVRERGFVARQLWLQFAELGEDSLSATCLRYLRAAAGLTLVPLWTTRRASPALVLELCQHDGSVRTIAGLTDERVVSSGDEGGIRVSDLRVPEAIPLELGQHEGWVMTLAMLPHEGVVTGMGGGEIRMWNLNRPQRDPVELGHVDEGAHALAVLPDGRVVSGGTDGRIRLWNPSVPRENPLELGRHHGWVQSVAVLPDGRVLSIGGRGPAISIRLVRLVHVIKLSADDRSEPVGETLAGDGRILVWDPAIPGVVQLELVRQRGEVDAMAVLPDGRAVLAGGSGGWLKIWDLTAAPRSPLLDLGRHGFRVTTVAPLSSRLVASGGRDGRICLWDVDKCQTRPSQRPPDDEGVCALAPLPDGRVVIGRDDGRISV